jgi:hypothetical protein
MLETIVVLVVIMWLLGMVSGYTIGSLLYPLLILAVVVFVIRLITGRHAV